MKYLVTGGTSGIGKEIALELLEEGNEVIITYAHNDEQAQNTQKEFKEKGYSVEVFKADISEEEQVKALFDFAKEKFGKLNGLVNNAGTNIDEFVETCSLENYMRVVNTNFIGKMLCSKYAIPLLKNQENACIVNISSSLGVRPDTECSAYCCSASAIITLTQCLAMELAEQNIRVNCVSPAFTPTPLSLAGWTEEEIKAKEKRNPRHRLGKVEDMANAVLFLLSEKADYINGENLKVNGGGILKK